MPRRGLLIDFAALMLVLSAAAFFAPTPWYLTDRETYEQVGREVVIPSCSSLHCFRKLVPVVIEQLPGSSPIKWKAYAVLSNVAAALAVGRLGVAFGLTSHAARLATWISALGFGSMFTLFDPHTADPLMFALAPALVLLLVSGRTARATTLSAIGIFAKEFAAAPLWIAVGARWLAGRRGPMRRALVAALGVTTLWIAFQLALITAFDYSYGDNDALRFTRGAYLAHWVRELGPRAAISALLIDYAPLYVLVPAGLLIAGGELRRWTWASIPTLVALAYVQQPDRAFWNFHFVAAPLAALAVSRLPTLAGWTFVALYGAVNLRVGAQLPFIPLARFPLALLLPLAVAATAIVWRHRAAARLDRDAATDRAQLSSRERRLLRWASAAIALVLASMAVLMTDLALHSRTETAGGVNKWGYRGPVLQQKQPDEIRIAVVGGRLAYGSGVSWEQTFPAVLQRYVRQTWRRNHVERPVSVANLAAADDSAPSYAATLEDYDYLQADIVLVVDEHDGTPPDRVFADGWRRRSIVYRLTGYLPALPDGLFERPSLAAMVATLDASLDGGMLGPTHVNATNDAGVWTMYCEAVDRVVGRTLGAGRYAIVVTPPYRTAGDITRQAALSTALASRAGTATLRYINLGTLMDLRNPAMSFDGVHLTPLGHEQVAEALTNPLLEIMSR